MKLHFAFEHGKEGFRRYIFPTDSGPNHAEFKDSPCKVADEGF
jgi:hypothetical protein